jgi:hypothetical protein
VANVGKSRPAIGAPNPLALSTQASHREVRTFQVKLISFGQEGAPVRPDLHAQALGRSMDQHFLDLIEPCSAER